MSNSRCCTNKCISDKVDCKNGVCIDQDGHTCEGCYCKSSFSVLYRRCSWFKEIRPKIMLAEQKRKEMEP